MQSTNTINRLETQKYNELGDGEDPILATNMLNRLNESGLQHQEYVLYKKSMGIS